MFTKISFTHWKSEPSLKIWHVASMLHGVEPRLLCDVVINEDGESLDISQMVNDLIEEVRNCELTAVVQADQSNPSAQTSLTKESVLEWLRSRKYTDLADSLDDTDPVIMKKADLVRKYEGQWPKIAEDLKRLGENGLAPARVGHGRWDERAVVLWGRQNGRIQTETPSGADLTKAWGTS